LLLHDHGAAEDVRGCCRQAQQDTGEDGTHAQGAG
jgi:hypothetical protein